MRQFASELGMANAAHPEAFGAMSIVTGLVFFATALGFYLAVKRLSGRGGLATTIGIFVALFGVNLIFAGLFPLPNPLHSAFGVALLTFFVPWLLAWACWNLPGARLANLGQIVATVVIVGTAILQTGLMGGVNGTNIGLSQRIAAAIFFLWLIATSRWLANRPSGPVD